ncbi:hypothetical protein VSO52_05115 [Pseudomonas fulva]|uniref:hypothetical protein n=1 Tax=Pseudomonas fulva TaxID=47880 RepID=UPI002DBED30B|nr:hypothetical protein [Pseudomonas fulva]MEC4022166.1 hypothetical protein [Pseudomonas fulva]
MTIDKAKLKALAEVCSEHGKASWLRPGVLQVLLKTGPADAEFIAAASPATVLALLEAIEGVTAQHGRDSAELRRLCQARDDARKERGQLKAENEDYKSGQDRYEQIIEDLKAEIEALRKALGDLLSLYEDDEGCRNLPEYIAGRAAMAKEASHD